MNAKNYSNERRKSPTSPPLNINDHTGATSIVLKQLKATSMTPAKKKTITFRKEKQRSDSNHVPRIRACEARHIYAANLREAVSLGEYFATFRKHYDLSKRRELPNDRALHFTRFQSSQHHCKNLKQYLPFFKSPAL
jgi:hypothetical protein